MRAGAGRYILILVSMIVALAQERPQGRSNTREFLGLGRAPDAAAAERGGKLYASACSFCHGAKATGGDTGPDLIRSAIVLHDDAGETIGPFIHKGRPDRGMPPFPDFTDKQLTDITEFLHMRVELAANRGTYKLAELVTGDAAAGKAFFEGAAKCGTCHSVTGDLAHIGSKLQPAELQQTFLYPVSRDFQPKAAHVTVLLPSGESISGTLKRLDDFEVALYDAAGEYHAYPIGPGVKVDVEDKLAAHRDLLSHYSDADMHNLLAYLVTLK